MRRRRGTFLIGALPLIAAVSCADGSTATSDAGAEAPPVDWGPPGGEDRPLGDHADAFTTSLGFWLHYRSEDGAAPPSVEVFRPDGEPYHGAEITAGEALHGKAMVPFETLMIVIEGPEPGYWTLKVDGADRFDGDDREVQYLHEVEHDLRIQPRMVFTSDCAPCWVFDVDLEGAPEGLAHVQSRGWIFQLAEESEDGQRFDRPWDLELLDDGKGLDRAAGDGRFASRPWAAAGGESYSLMAEMIGMAKGHPFARRASLDLGDAEVAALPLPPLREGGRYEIRVGGDLVAAPGGPETIPVGTIRLTALTPEGDAELEWLSQSDSFISMLAYFGSDGAPDRLSVLVPILGFFRESGSAEVRALR